MIGSFQETQALVSKLSVPELMQIAKNPTPGDPNAQYAAIGEIERRNQMQAPPQAPVNEPTVIDKMAMGAMPRPQGPVPGQPIPAGIQAIAAQQMQGAPQRMAGGGQARAATGRILNNLDGIMALLQPRFNTEAMSPDDARGTVGEFFGPADYLTDLIPGIKDDEVEADRDRQQALWLALAQAGFGMASTGNIGQGALMGMEQARGALDDHRDSRRSNRERMERIALAQGERGDRLAGMGLETLLQDRNRAENAEQNLLSSSVGIAQAGEQIDSADRRDANSSGNDRFNQIVSMLMQENEGEMVEDGEGVGMSPDGERRGNPVPFLRPYNRNDAVRDALLMMGGRRGSTTAPDDASELTRIATALADPMVSRNPEGRANLIRLYNATAARARANGMDAPPWGEGGGAPASAQDNAAPTEAGFNRDNVTGLEEYRSGRANAVIGERDGQTVLSPYTAEYAQEREEPRSRPEFRY